MSLLRDFANLVKTMQASAANGAASEPVVRSHPLADTHPLPGSKRQPQPPAPPQPPEPPPQGGGRGRPLDDTARQEVSVGPVSQNRAQLVFEQKRLQEKLNKPQDYTGREADEARLAEVNKQLGESPQSQSAPPPQQGGVKGKETMRSVPPAPAQPKGNPRKNQPVDDIPPQEMTDKEFAEHEQRARDYKMPYHGSPGDGDPFTVKEALTELAKPNGAEVTLASSHAHADLWEQMGRTGPAPDGFRYGCKFWLEEKRLTPEQLKVYKTIDQKRNPHRYPPEEGGGEGGKPGESKGPGEGKKPAGGNAEVSQAGQKVEQKIDNYDGRANEFKKQRDELDKRESEHQAKKKQGQVSEADLNKEEQQLAKEADVLEKESQALESEGEALSRELHSLPEAEIKGLTLKGAAAKLGEAAALVQGIAHILQADSPTDALKRTAEVEANLAEAALIQAITKSNIVTGIVSVIIGMSSDQGSGLEADRAAKIREGEEEQMILKVTADFLQKEHPGSAEWKGNGPVIHDQKLWDATLAQVRRLVAQKKQEAAAAGLATAKYHLQRIGLQDGMAGKREHEDEAGFATHGGDDASKARRKELEDVYDAAYADGDAKFQPTLKRARDLGAADRKAGNRQQNRDEVATWYDFAADRLLEAYDEGYNQSADGVGTGSETS